MNQITCTLIVGVTAISLTLAAQQPTKQFPHEEKTTAKVKQGESRGAVQYKIASWPNELRAGDCGQKPGTLTIGSDGSLHWEAVTYTYSTHSGDIWHASFNLLDKDGVSLGSTAYHDSPRMNDGNGGPPPKYRWTADDTYNGANFAAIVSVTEGYKC